MEITIKNEEGSISIEPNDMVKINGEEAVFERFHIGPHKRDLEFDGRIGKHKRKGSSIEGDE